MTTSDRRVAIVTGAARGIGAAVAQRLAHDGFDVAVLDLDEAACADTVESCRKEGVSALAVAVDVADEDAVGSAVDRLAGELGAPTVLVNNAGIIRDNFLAKMPSADWDAVLNVHLRGAYLMSRAVQSFMREARWGRIVNMSSGSALGNPGQANYAAAKAGIQGFTKTLAKELGRFGVTVNSVAPGFVVTDMTAATAQRIGVPFEKFRDSIVQGIPIGRAGEPEDIAAAVAFFVREDAGYVSGQVLYAAGGPMN
jgi:3-oxoacyl-[acyl-carrier protein] reductase